MKKTLILVGVAAFLFACNSPGVSTSAEEAQEVAEATETSRELTINTETSTVSWMGSKITGDNHAGTVKISSGSIAEENGVLTSGNFVLDMTSLESTDGMDEEQTGKLLGHLKSPAFFNVDSFDAVKFEITDATADSLTGNLSIKGITKAITFPYFFQSEDSSAMATAVFSIDRSLWDVRYGSNSFFDGLGEKAINNAIEFDVKLSMVL